MPSDTRRGARPALPGGEPDAFEALVQRHGTRVYYLCLRVLGDADEAADVAQDTFLAALRKLEHVPRRLPRSRPGSIGSR